MNVLGLCIYKDLFMPCLLSGHHYMVSTDASGNSGNYVLIAAAFIDAFE
jgi:hypothetical protein